ncbi:MAG TPA: HupE/UreJ family protein [Opitutaceae bacterium]
MRLLTATLALISMALFCPSVWAHDPGISSASLVVSANQLELVTTFARSDARWLLAEGKGEIIPDKNYTEDALKKSALDLWHLRINERERTPVSILVLNVPGDNVAIKETYHETIDGTCDFETRVFGLLPPGHRQHFSISLKDDHLLLAKLLSADDFVASAFVRVQPVANSGTAPANHAISFTGFLRLGIEHILTGYDHLLFLFAFLITAKGIKPILKIITSFTVAHSITLGLSALNIVYLPSRLVEPLIAATIVFVALQNLFRRDRLGERAALTFVFGLIHGFGFAAVLRDMGISSLGSSAWRALGGFNLGVEIGQIAVASVVLPLLWYLRARPSYTRRWMPTASAAIVLAGTFWFIQRVVGT